MHTRPVWAEISRSNLLANYRELRNIADRYDCAGHKLELLAVVKANAYGHGILECAPLLVDAGVRWIGVTCVEEGVNIRAVCPDVRILVMSGIWQGEADAVIEHGLTPVVWEGLHFDLLQAALLRHAPKRLPVHLELDTGMSRQGLRTMSAGPGVDPVIAAVLSRFSPQSPLWLEGLMTHFSDPEVLDSETTQEQIRRLDFASRGFHPRYIHAGNSATLLRENELDPMQRMAESIGACLMLRPGLALYGYAPRFYEHGRQAELPARILPDLRPVLAWKTRVASLRVIEPGDTAGYNGTFKAARKTRLALLPLGYADGFNRLLSNCGSVLIRGQRAPIAGRVSMDQTIVDVTGIPGVEIGDEAVLIGTQGGQSIDAYDIADLTGTIPYEVVCGISARVPRVYVD